MSSLTFEWRSSVLGASDEGGSVVVAGVEVSEDEESCSVLEGSEDNDHSLSRTCATRTTHRRDAILSHTNIR
jgi:hypothetical protein